MDIKEALRQEIAATQEKLDKLKAALKALNGDRREAPAKPVHPTDYGDKTAEQALADLIMNNFDQHAPFTYEALARLARKMLRMPRGTVSSNIYRLKKRGFLKATEQRSTYLLNG